MTAIHQVKRALSAKDMAKKLNVSERTVRNLIAESRDDYESRAADRRKVAAEMKDAGHSWAEIADAVGGTEWAARGLVRRYNAEVSK